MTSTLRAYAVGSDHEWTTAVLVFATTARQARNLGADMLVNGYGCCEFLDVRVRWLRDGAPAWEDGVTESTVVEAEGCETCGIWWPDWRPTEADRTCPQCHDMAEMGCPA